MRCSKVLYDRSFVTAIPVPVGHETRPLVNIKAHHPWLLNNLNRWHNELELHGQNDLWLRLRSVQDAERFTSGLWELVLLCHLKQKGDHVVYNRLVHGKTPDLYWPAGRLIGDIVSISDPYYGSREDVFIHEVANDINTLPHRFDVYIKRFKFSGQSYKRRAITDWIRFLPTSEMASRDYEYSDGESYLKIAILRKTEGHAVKMMGTFSLDSNRLRTVTKRRIEDKIRKYQRRMIVFACSGLGNWPLMEDTLNMALYGDWQVVFS